MTDDEKHSLRAARFQFVMVDPYPEISEWENHESMRRSFRQFFWLGGKPKPEISPHKAWMDGFNFAWKLRSM